jgi:hypothetical protein
MIPASTERASLNNQQDAFSPLGVRAFPQRCNIAAAFFGSHNTTSAQAVVPISLTRIFLIDLAINFCY